MNYKPRPGDIGLSYSGSIIGKMVRVAQSLVGDWAVYSHAFIVLHDGYIIEALPQGAQISHLSKYDQSPVVFSRFDLTLDQRDSICEEAIRLEGTPYSWLDFVAIGLNHYVPHWACLSKRIEARVLDSGKMICSQLCAEAYKRAGIDLAPGVNPQYITPGDISQMILMDFGKKF